jgi:peroxiredoxin
MNDGDSGVIMTTTVFNGITLVLEVAALVALGIALVSCVLMLVRWKTPKRRGHAIRLAGAIAAIVCLIGVHQAILWFVFLPALGRQQMAEIEAAQARRFAETTFVRVGDAVPEFSLTTIDGETVSLPAPGKVVLINFFATWCGPCQVELPHIERIWSDLRSDDRFRLVVVGREETAETVQAYRREHSFTFPMAADPERKVYSLFAKELIPRTVVVSPAGQVVYATAGFYEDEVEELHALLKEQLAAVK